MPLQEKLPCSRYTTKSGKIVAMVACDDNEIHSQNYKYSSIIWDLLPVHLALYLLACSKITYDATDISLRAGLVFSWFQEKRLPKWQLKN